MAECETFRMRSRVSWSTTRGFEEVRRFDEDEEDVEVAETAAAVAAAAVEDVELALDFRPWDREGRPLVPEVGPMAGL